MTILRSLFRVLTTIVFALSFPSLAYSADIKNEQITPSTTMPIWSGYTVDKLADGLSVDSGPKHGFTTNNKTGTIRLSLDKAYNIEGFKLWNDVTVRAEGVKDFRLIFFKNDGTEDTSQVFTARSGQVDAQSFSFPEVKNVIMVDLVILSSLKEQNTFAERIEIRELAFIEAGSAPLPVPSWVLGGAVLLLLVIAFAVIKSLFGGGNKLPKRPEKRGFVFLGSPLLAGNVAAPLSTAGQLTASNLQTLTGPYTVLRPAYLSTGRIGFAQKGKPTNKDIAFGTGFLITPNHVMTNRHVYEVYKDHLTGKSGGGIEFHAEKDKDATDFVAFDGNAPYLPPGIDIAIFKLSRPVTDRKPIPTDPVDIDTLNDRDIVVVGYPCPRKITEYVTAAVEDDPVFAVKRISQGKIFRHSTDTSDPYGIEAPVSEQIRPSGNMPAVCHNASTLGGSSGSPLLDEHTGELLGVHFGFDVSFEWEEAANFAMAIKTVMEGLKNFDTKG